MPPDHDHVNGLTEDPGTGLNFVFVPCHPAERARGTT